jgi:hypothetical protein
VLVLVLATLGAQPPPDPAVAVFDEQLGSRWYGLYRDGAKVGWLESRFVRAPWRGMDALIAEGHAVTVTRAAGREHRTELNTVHRFEAAAPHRLLVYESSTTRGDLTETRGLRAGPGGSGWIATTKRGREREQVRPADLGDYTLGRFLALERWVAARPSLGDVVATARLDPTALVVRPAEASVVGVTHTIVDAVQATVFSLASFDGGGAATITRYDHEGRILAVEGGEVDLRLEDEATATALDVTVDLFLDALVRLREGVLERPQDLGRLVLEVPAAAAALLPAGAGQLSQVDHRWQLEIAPGSPLAVAPGEEAEWLAADPTAAKRVGQLVGQALPKRINKRDAAERLALFVRDYLADDRAAEPLDLAGVIDGRRGDCTEHAALYVAMARHAGLPAREATGLMWVAPLGAFGGHAWAEVALDGRWVPVDPTWGQVPADATHIRLSDAPAVEAATRRALREGGVAVIAAEPR